MKTQTKSEEENNEHNIVTKYVDALSTIDNDTYKYIELRVNDKLYYGVEIEESEQTKESFCVGGYDRFLLINCTKEDIEFFNGCIQGKGFSLYGEVNGDDFIFLGKCIDSRHEIADIKYLQPI